jgi:hypothetical protein
MNSRFAIGVFILSGAASLLAAKPDPRLAVVRHAFISPVDELGDDVQITSCFVAQLPKSTPITVVQNKDDADVIFKVQAHLPSGTTRVMLGAMGGSPSAHLYATTPDGTKLWDDGAKFRRANVQNGKGLQGDATQTIECSLANELINTLRDAMREARDKK